MIKNAKSYILFSDYSDTIISMYHEKDCKDMECNHFHPLIEIMLIVSGECQMKSGKTVIEAEKGDIFLFRSMEPHQLFHIENSSVEILTLTFSSTIFQTAMQDWIPVQIFDVFYGKEKSFQNKIPQNKKAAGRIGEIMLSIKNEMENVNASDNEYIIKAKFLEILAILDQYYTNTIKKGKLKSQKHSSEIEATLIYIREHLTENITLDQLAKIANMSKSYYCTAFKNLNGTTVWDFILSERIHLAISYLHNFSSKITILNLATMCGFNNTVNFNKCFKKMLGLTPNEYRKKLYETTVVSNLKKDKIENQIDPSL